MSESVSIPVEITLCVEDTDADGSPCGACGDDVYFNAKKLGARVFVFGNEVDQITTHAQLCASCGEIIRDALNEQPDT